MFNFITKAIFKKLQKPKQQVCSYENAIILFPDGPTMMIKKTDNFSVFCNIFRTLTILSRILID